jgi:hypothetical protein
MLRRLLPAATRRACRRAYTATAGARAGGDWPDHELLPLAALSPTMERGGVAAWAKEEGDAINAGDVV